jgi:Zn finger protein HypA/HybF involved in hydrogenase expression
MKRKIAGKGEKVIADEILENARLQAGVEPRKRKEKCEVCGSLVAPNANELLCWVCRRLKISAWRDSDLQASAPE